ncbi:leucine-rich repeat protein [Bacteroides salyersiae]|uniref:leucine-rich repeat protein n=1 Tax=Bacteroides salyersiae TaxID=291644 RepID=UPI001E35674A|nr:leucine-rich repeat protein [Bacteroides salyersiae]
MKAIAEGTFTMEMIENWTGEGENKAALAIQWNAEGETNALVWGYRWDGEATGEKMIRDIAAADPRFFCMTETGTAYGSTIAGLGYDVNKSGDFAVQKDGKIYYPDEEGVIFTGGYGYDGFTCLDPEDYWQSGWYQGYWSYWLKSSDESAWGYSGVGATGRKLTDGCWDGWNFAVNMSSQPWKEMAPAAKNGPTAPSIKIQPESIVVSPGESATFAPEFKGDTLVYQWYKNEIAIPDAKTPHYTIPSVTVEDAGSYYCIVKNILDEISTDTVTLTVGNKNITAIPGSEPNTAIVTYDDSYITYSGLLTIPSTIKLNGSDYSIIGIDNMAFKGCNKLTSIILPDNLTTLGEKAFSGCTALSSIILPNEVEQIGDETFSGCSALTSITVNDKLKSIGRAAFENCIALTDIILPDNVETIGSSTFKNCEKLSSVILGNSITELGDSTFLGCSTLKNIILPSSLQKIGVRSFNGCSSLINVELGHINSIGDVAFNGCTALTSITFPNNLTSIGNYAFFSCTELLSATLGTGVFSVPNYTFNNCSKLATIVLSENITSIGQYAFQNCTSLAALPLTANITQINNYAFKGCTKLTSIEVPDQITSLGTYVFQNCTGITHAKIGSGITTLSNYTFYGCSNLEKVELSEKITSIGSYAFYNCQGLKILPITNAITTIGANAFYGCKGLTSAVLSDNITSLGGSAFYNCSSLEEVTLGSGITKLESSLFRNNSQLKKVVANGIITSLATYTFNGCSALECIYIKSESVPTASSNTFTNVPETCIIFVPETSVNAYKEANYWKNFIISPWLSSLEIVSTTPSMDFGNGEEANIDKDTKTFTITFNRNIVEKDNISATLKFEDELVNDQILTASYADNVLTLNREGERLPAGKYTLVLTTSESVLNITFNVAPWLPELEIVSTTPSMDFGNGEEANIDKDTKTFTITFNRNIVEEDNISATLKLEDELVNDQILTASYADNVLTLNREGERLSAGKYTLVLTTSESVLNITFNVEPWLPELEIVSTTPSMDFGNGEEANIDKDTKTFTITFNRNIVEEDNISATLKLENELVNDQVLTASYTDNVLTLNREGEKLPAGKYTLVLTTSESVLNITFNVINGGVGIENQSSEKIVHTKEYYTINGTALPQPIPGFNIIKITYEDGTVEVSKIYIRSSVNQ